MNHVIDKIFHSTNNEKREMNEILIQQINKDIDDYTLDVNDFIKRYEKVYKYQNMFLFVIYKNKKIITVFEKEGDTRKSVILQNVKNAIERLEKKLGTLPDLFLPFYVSDTHFYHDNEIPFFVEAKPKNQKGILYPDKDFYSIQMEGKQINYDQLKNIIHKHDCTQYSKKEPIIYFSGANTGSDKHNIRMKLKEVSFENKEENKNYELYVSEQYVPLYDFCKYKYLLNLPGHQPWSYRMSKILLMGSLVIDVSVLQTYIYQTKENKVEINNEKWIQLFSPLFKKNEDYIELIYPWIEGVTSDKNVHQLYDKINNVFEYYQKHTDEYKRITENASKKTNLIDMKMIDSSFEYVIYQFNKCLYEKNSKKDVEDFMNYFIKISGKEVFEMDDRMMKIMDIDSGLKIQEDFFQDNLPISLKKIYHVLSFGDFLEDKLKIIYNNIIKLNKNSHLTIISDDKKKIKWKEYQQISFIHNVPILTLLNEAENKNKYQFIFIFEEREYKDLFQELSLSWNILEYGGYLIVDLYNISMNEDSIDNYQYFKTFRGIYSQQIMLFEKIGKRVMIRKYKKNHKIIDVSESIQKFVKNYINTFPKEKILILPSQKKEKIHWDFVFTQKKPIEIKNYELYKKSQKILQEYHKDKEFEEKLDRFDLGYILNQHHLKYLNKVFLYVYKNIIDLFGNNRNNNLNESVKKIYQILYFEKQYYKLKKDQLNSMKKVCKKNNSYRVLRLRTPYINPDPLQQISKLTNDFKKYSTDIYFNYIFPVNIDLYKNEINLYKNDPITNKKYLKHQYIKMNKNYFDLDYILLFLKKIKHKMNYLQINLNNEFVERHVLSSFVQEELNMIIQIHMLYLILSLQEKDGVLFYEFVPFTTNVQMEILQIFNNYYDKVYISSHNNEYRHKNTTSIHCIGFRGIEKEELESFYQSYRQQYDLHIKEKKDEWIRKEKLEDNKIVNERVKNTSFLYLNQIFSNSINKEIINQVSKYYNSYFEEIHQNIQDKIKLDQWMKKSSKNVQRYIFLTLFNEQYIHLLENKANMKKYMFEFYNKCKKT